jgi:hypothetical protein
LEDSVVDIKDLKGSVGDGGGNAVHDVALIQAMLKVVKNAKGEAYLSKNYTGKYDDATKAAAFQADKMLIDPATLKFDPAALKLNPPEMKVDRPAAKPGLAAVKLAPPTIKLNPAGAANHDKTGLVDKESQTLNALIKALPDDYKAMRIIEGTKTVYLEATVAAYKESFHAIQSKNDGLDLQFRQKIAQLLDRMYNEYKIVLSIPSNGWRRSFADQADVLKKHTDALPGESNHQYGKAVDFGFNGLRWVDGDGQIRTDGPWLDWAKMPVEKREELWKARNKFAVDDPTIGLFKSNRKGDWIHLQAYDDNKVSYGRALASHLQAVSPNKMKWQVALGSPNNYKTDLGLGGATFAVGTAGDIWAGKATIDKEAVAKALNVKRAADKNFSIDKFLGLQPGPAAQNKAADKMNVPVALKGDDIKDGYVTILRDRLKAEFEAADAKWRDWQPVLR